MDLDKEYYMGMMGVEASASAMSPAVSSEPVAKAVAATASEDEGDLRRGPWTAEEDALLVDYVAEHGEGRWNSLARCAGLRRTGKSCRLRWLNYLRPDVRRGNITAEEQLLILDLHSRWGNRWSKIAQRLPGRTDNEIKNYWRTRVQKHARQLRCDVNSRQFRDVVRLVWMPRLIERMHADAKAGVPPAPEATAAGAAAAAEQCYGGGHVERQGMSRSEPMIGQAAEAAAMSPDDTSSTLRSSVSTAEMASTMHGGQYRLSPWGATSDVTANNADGTPVNCVVRGDEGAMGGDDRALHGGGDDELGGSWSELLATTGLPEFEFGDFDDNLWSLEDIYAN